MDNQPPLWSIDSFESRNVPDFVRNAYTDILPYIKSFLTSKHPHRNGVVCPFMPQAIKNQEIYFTYFEPQHNCDETITNCLKFYTSHRDKKTFGAIIILFPEDFSIEELLKIHIRNKEQCIRQSMMLGALYRTSSAPSLHSSEYYPLRTPTPILVLRDITASDLVFLEPDHYSLKSKHIFLSAFIRHFSADRRSSYTDLQLAKAITLRKFITYKIIFSRLLLASCLVTTVMILTLFL
ncbi:DUF6875 domain-containing protein [Pseudomonas citrulli]|uniref:DUF6875 domain-containing protein n=1 Tax=Pseudomonas citrulli TaxID=3064347 RepID=UPI00351081E3